MIETERLILRKLQDGDEQAIYENWTSDDEVTKYLTWPTHRSIETTKKILAMWLKEQENENCYRWGIVLKSSNQLIGMIDVVALIEGNPEIGYVLSRAYWGKGYMTEAFKAVVDDLFAKGYSKIWIKADERNIGSNRVIEKNGFQFLKKETHLYTGMKTFISTTNTYVKEK